MTELEGIAQTIYDEVMDEIEEEITEALEEFILADKLENMISGIKDAVSEKVVETIKEIYKDDMKASRKMILGEKIARIVTAEAKEQLQDMVAKILKQSFDVVDELRNEIIGEVFEETE